MDYAIEVLENEIKLLKGALSVGSWKGYEKKRKTLEKRIIDLQAAIYEIEERIKECRRVAKLMQQVDYNPERHGDNNEHFTPNTFYKNTKIHYNNIKDQ